MQVQIEEEEQVEKKLRKNGKKLRKVEEKTLPEAQWTQGIEFKT